MMGRLHVPSVARAALTLAVIAGLFVAACTGAQAPPRPDDACVAACERRIPRCGVDGCQRGCQLALDRLVEHEEAPVLACVERSPAACDAWLWAECAARVGPHLDGGPPPPPDGLRH